MEEKSILGKRVTTYFLKSLKPSPYLDPSRLKNGYESLYSLTASTLVLSRVSRREVTSAVRMALASVSSLARQAVPSSFFTYFIKILTSPWKVRAPSLYFSS